MSRRVFLSAANEEFAPLFAELERLLRKVDIDVEYQPVMAQVTEDTLEKLHNYIQPSDLVVHLTGHKLGSNANPRAVAAYFKKHNKDNFLGDHPKVRKAFDGLNGCTYTQWESYLALQLGKDLLVHAPSDAFDETKSRIRADFAQAAHLSALAKAGRYAYPFESVAEILTDIYKHFGIRPPVPRKIAPSRILRHSPERLFGREKYLEALDDAWADSDHINIYTLVAWGGVGKTSLVAHWVQQRMVAQNWPAVDRYFDWSFYSQGTGESRQTSSDLFINESLTFFGDPDPTVGGPWERGQRLAALIRQHRTLLVLDGIEPLQYPPTDKAGQAGMLKDQGLQSLLAGLAADNRGLCIITTRETLTDLQQYRGSTAPERKVDKLLREAAVSLLRHLQIVGTEEELTAAWQDAGGHALTLQLLGRFIVDAFPDKDIRHRSEVGLEEADTERQGRSAFKVMAAYEKWLQGAGAEQQRELAILRLTGLFDRPIPPGCLHALRSTPAIPGLTDTIEPLNDRQWNMALNRLKSIDLISTSVADPEDPNLQTPNSDVALDAHPLIREYFASQLREQQPEAFIAGHSRLFDHLCEATDHQPDTLEGLQPLYQAVVHGCLAQRQQEACDKVYVDRILRGTGSDGFYSAKKLGAIGTDLSAVAAFFDEPWSVLSPNLSEPDQAWLLGEAAFNLRALGRLTEAVEPMKVSGEMDVELQKWQRASASYGNLSELQLTLGRVDSAVVDARQAVEFADRSEDAFERMGKRTTAGDALHQFGERAEAAKLFATAETMQRERQPTFPLLYSLSGFRYCDLLLAPAETAAWRAVLCDAFSSEDEGSAKLDLTQQENADDPANEFSRESVSQIDGNSDIDSLPNHAEHDGNAACDEVDRRGRKMIEWRVPNDSVLDIALDHLTLARAALYRAMLSVDPDRIQPSDFTPPPELAAAVNGLREAGQMHELPKGLITAAVWYHLGGDYGAAVTALNEAHQIAARGPMPLFTADILLTRARLFGRLGGTKAAGANGEKDDRPAGSLSHDYPWPDSSPQQDLAEARRIIEECHYHRRLPELEDAEAALLTKNE